MLLLRAILELSNLIVTALMSTLFTGCLSDFFFSRYTDIDLVSLFFSFLNLV
nr:MAG TPA: hypothetical protein [Caudoviricetes sp.]